MEGIRSTQAYQPLTQLYTDAKRSYQALSQQVSTDDTPEMASLHRKSRMQKDRLIAWGLEWQDQNSTNGDSIDESLTHAGIFEATSSIMDNIKQTIDETDRLCNSKKDQKSTPPARGPSGYPLEKVSANGSWSSADMQKYEELINNLTASIDLLCDISQSKRMEASSKSEKGPLSSKDSKDGKMHEPRDFPQFPVQAPFTSFNSFKMNRSDLILPQETPPPYEGADLELPTRIIGQVRAAGSTIPVLVEYASYDSMYLETGVPLPYTRVEHFAALLGHDTSAHSLLRLRGFFEDHPRPRIGFVYQLPNAVASNPQRSGSAPVSLFDLLHPVEKQTNFTIPPLEQRFRMALDLCNGMKFLLDKGFSHRGINSNSFFFFPNASGAGSINAAKAATPAVHYDLRNPVMSSFDFFSEYNLEKMPETIQHNMYRHPEDPRVKNMSSWASQYNARFDLYSFGLVLLEIGLWMPLSDIFKDKYSLADFRLRVGKIWVRKLPGKVTTPFMKAVNTCLSANDNNFLRALERAIHKLELCCLSEEEDSGDEEFQMNFDPTEAETMSQAALQGADSVSPGRSMTGNRPPRSSTMVSLDATMTEAPPVVEPAEPKQCDCIFADQLKVFSEMAVSPAVRQQCDLLRQKLEPFVERVLRKQHEGCSIALEMLGDSEERARPYMHIVCKSTNLVYTYVNKFFKGDETYCDIAVSQGRIMRSKAQTKTRTGDVGRCAATIGGDAAQNPDHQQLPSCGASIGAYYNDYHLPPVSLGGLVNVDGKTYGMTVHHLLEDPDAEGDDVPNQAPSAAESEQRSRMQRPAADDVLDDLDAELMADLAAIKAGKPLVQPVAEDGDVPGIEYGSGAAIDITQPALDDIPADFYPDLEDRDEEHLLSYKFGKVHASSGLRRMTREGVDHEIDWLLLQVDEERQQTRNVVPGGRLFCRNAVDDSAAHLREPVWRKQFKSSQDLYPRKIASSAELAGLTVHSFGRTTGLGWGKISSSMSSIKFPGRTKFTQTWTVRGNFGHPGDSGAWVVDNKEGRICGYVLGWSSRQECAIIAPMDVTFEHMKTTLMASRISLPGGEETVASQGQRDTFSPGAAGSEEGKRARMMANHYLMSGSPGHLEREWASRRATLGSEQVPASS